MLKLKLDDELLVLRASIKFAETPLQRLAASQPIRISSCTSDRPIVSIRPTRTKENLNRMLAVITMEKMRTCKKKLDFKPSRNFVHEGALV
jgi:hypothetical protein